MAWEREIAGQFPPPREGEPPNLRGDIADELADHLACSAEKEMERGEDESVARRTALDRFGDPAAMARKLWMDAMKERIMKDRILVAACLILAMAAIGAAGLAWRATNQGEARMTSALEAASKSNAALLAALDKMQTGAALGGAGAGAANDLPADKAMLSYQVTKNGKPDGEPVAGIRVELRGSPFTDKDEALALNTDSNGRVTFGPINPGAYVINFAKYVGLPFQAAFREYENVTLFSGKRIAETVAAPNEDISGVSIAIDWPDRIKNRGLAATVEVTGYAGIGKGSTWTVEKGLTVLLDDQNRMLAAQRDQAGRSEIYVTKDEWGNLKEAEGLIYSSVRSDSAGALNYPNLGLGSVNDDEAKSSRAGYVGFYWSVADLHLAPIDSLALPRGEYCIYADAVSILMPFPETLNPDHPLFSVILDSLVRLPAPPKIQGIPHRGDILAKFNLTNVSRKIVLKLTDDQIDAIDRRATVYENIAKRLEDEMGANSGQTDASAK